MSVVLVVDHPDLVGPDLRWPLRIASLRATDIAVLVRVPGTGEDTEPGEPPGVSAQPADADSVRERLEVVLDTILGPEQWTSSPVASPGETGVESPSGPRVVQLRRLPADQLLDAAGQLARQSRSDLAVFVGGEETVRRDEWLKGIGAAAATLSCSMAVVIPGARPDGGKVLVAAGRGPHGRAAIDLAAALGAETSRGTTALYVEPDIGPDAESVGQRILDRRLRDAIGESARDAVARDVAIQDDVAKGIIEACREESVEVVVLGAARLGGRGQLLARNLPLRVLRAKPMATLIAVRGAVPVGGRLLRWFASQVHRRVPQLTREGRVDLVERIQSNSQWNFDFMLLTGLAALIASLGLLDDSAAVIIGAMLVAPLMTPLLGLGLAIAQENSRLAQMTLKATTLGFAAAFVIAFAIGLLIGDFYEPTGEMESRNWPQLLDLVVAFVSGLAAAYAYGRPGLLAALPGVAIAAALVPPVAASGLATSIGDYDLALGAILLFAVNIVAIVVSAALSLRAMGIVGVGKPRVVTRLLRNGLAIATIAVALGLTFSPPLLAPPIEVVSATEAAIGEEWRLREIRLRRKAGSPVLQVDLGGSRLPDAVLQGRLQAIVREHLGEDAGVRLTFRYEVLVDQAPVAPKAPSGSRDGRSTGAS